MPETGHSWSQLRAPGLEDFEVLARTAFEALPEAFRAHLEGVPIAIADFPEDDVLDSMGIEDAFGLMGLFEGVGLPQMGDGPATGQMPNRIWLYRRPILDFWAAEEDLSLGEIVTHVLVHEIGHHFGYSDADMEAIEAAAQADPE